VFPGRLKKDALEAGNPLATYAAMIDLESQYRQSKIFAGIYSEIRFNFEEFLGLPLAGVQAMSLPALHRKTPSMETPIPVSYEPESALKVIEREAGKTRLVVFGEEHHLPQTRSLYESLLRVLWRQGYHYLAAEAFTDEVMRTDFKYPDYQSGYYLLDPVFASAVRVAKSTGYKLVAYDTTERGSGVDASFRDRTQAENIKARTFDRDPQAKVFIIAGRGHASEETAQDVSFAELAIWPVVGANEYRRFIMNGMRIFAALLATALSSWVCPNAYFSFWPSSNPTSIRVCTNRRI